MEPELLSCRTASPEAMICLRVDVEYLDASMPRMADALRTASVLLTEQSAELPASELARLEPLTLDPAAEAGAVQCQLSISQDTGIS
jgi:hypothetical protein